MTDAPHPLPSSSGTTDATALARMLFGTDDTELMTVQQLLDYKVIQLALAQARRETRKEYEWILKEIIEWGMQTEKSDLDLTTAEFGEIWRGAQKLLAKMNEAKS